MHEKMDIMTRTSEGYLRVRYRFLSTFKRDVLELRLPPQERSKLLSGNISAHGGDALADAQLYQNGDRQDDMVYILLYGLPWQKIVTLSTYPWLPRWEVLTGIGVLKSEI